MLRELILAATVITALLQISRATAAEVTIDNFTFTPAQTSIHVGDTVTFVNHDDIPHSVVGKDGKFRSKTLDTDDTFTFTFATIGEYPFFCGLHPHMLGKVVVTP